MEQIACSLLCNFICWPAYVTIFINAVVQLHFLISIDFTLQWKWLVLRKIDSLSSVPLLMHCSTLLSHRSACRCQECKVVKTERGRGTAQLPDVASVKERRARWVGCLILACSSAILYNLSSVECLYSCFLSSGVPWGVSIGNRFTTTFLCTCGSGESEAVHGSEWFERPFWSSYKIQYLCVSVLHVGTCLALTLRWKHFMFPCLGEGSGQGCCLKGCSTFSALSSGGELQSVPFSVNVNFIPLKWTLMEFTVVLCLVSWFLTTKNYYFWCESSLYLGVFLNIHYVVVKEPVMQSCYGE